MPLQIDPKHIKSEMTTDAELAAGLALKASLASPTFTGTVTVPNLVVSTSIAVDKTITPAGTTGNRTINKPLGTVNFAAGAETLTVTNSLVTVNSVILCTMRTDNLNATVWSVVAAAGSFVITLSAAPEIEVSVGFMVYN